MISPAFRSSLPQRTLKWYRTTCSNAFPPDSSASKRHGIALKTIFMKTSASASIPTPSSSPAATPGLTLSCSLTRRPGDLFATRTRRQPLSLPTNRTPITTASAPRWNTRSATCTSATSWSWTSRMRRLYQPRRSFVHSDDEFPQHLMNLPARQGRGGQFPAGADPDERQRACEMWACVSRRGQPLRGYPRGSRRIGGGGAPAACRRYGLRPDCRSTAARQSTGPRGYQRKRRHAAGPLPFRPDLTPEQGIHLGLGAARQVIESPRSSSSLWLRQAGKAAAFRVHDHDVADGGGRVFQRGADAVVMGSFMRRDRGWRPDDEQIAGSVARRTRINPESLQAMARTGCWPTWRIFINIVFRIMHASLKYGSTGMIQTESCDHHLVMRQGSEAGLVILLIGSFISLKQSQRND